jgi:hypothetical protein
MTLTIELPPELDERLQEEAGREGYTAEEYACKVLKEHLLPGDGGLSLTPATSEERFVHVIVRLVAVLLVIHARAVTAIVEDYNRVFHLLGIFDQVRAEGIK